MEQKEIYYLYRLITSAVILGRLLSRTQLQAILQQVCVVKAILVGESEQLFECCSHPWARCGFPMRLKMTSYWRSTQIVFHRHTSIVCHPPIRIYLFSSSRVCPKISVLSLPSEILDNISTTASRFAGAFNVTMSIDVTCFSSVVVGPENLTWYISTLPARAGFSPLTTPG